MVDRIEARVVLLAALLLEARSRRDVDLAAEDRLHTRIARLLVELDGAEQIAVVGHRDRRHAERLRAREERLVLDRAVEQRELGVQVQVGEGSRHSLAYSHSIVAGGFDEMSYTTRDTPFTSLVMRLDARASTSCESRAQSAVIASTEVTARSATTWS